MDKLKAAQEKIKKLEETIAKNTAALAREKGRFSEKERKTRVRRLIHVGGLAEMVDLLDADSGFLLGCLMGAATISPDSERWKGLKAKGDALLKVQEAASKKAAKAVGAKPPVSTR